jgi:hypothetical protein
MALPTQPTKNFDDIPPPPGINSPEDYLTVVPSDNTDMRFRCRVIWCGTAGDVAFLSRDGSTSVTLKSVPANVWVQLRTNRILATGTTAVNIVAGA